MTKVNYFKWNDMLYKRMQTGDKIQWYNVTFEQNVKGVRASIMEGLYLKYPQYINRDSK